MRTYDLTDIDAFPEEASLVAVERAACELAESAARLVRERYGTPLDIAYKSEDNTDPVTDVDRGVESYIASSIAKRFPSHAILGEEGQGSQDKREYYWVIDPIDGTLNFINGLPLFAISIGVLFRCRPIAGALLFPITGDLLHARYGGGAFRNGKPMRANPASEMQNSWLSGWSPEFWSEFRMGTAIGRKSGQARSIGSLAYELGMVASGTFCQTVCLRPRIWDLAAGVIIVREAGGTVLHYSKHQRAWLSLDRFTTTSAKTDQSNALRAWSAPILAGTDAITATVARVTPHRASYKFTKWRRR